MGLIEAGLGAAGGALADAWKDYFYCEAIPADIIMQKGHKRVSGRSSNYKGSDNIITHGSVITVADGQCMIIVEDGQVVDLCATPGKFIYDRESEPSLFDDGKFEDNLKAVFRNIGKRFTFGGEVPRDQRIYYMNTKELLGAKYGTATPIPFRIYQPSANIDFDMPLRCFGEYSYRIVNPILFYTNVCANVSEDYRRDSIEGQLKAELLNALQPAFARLSDMGVRYSALPSHAKELARVLKEELNEDWTQHRGISIERFTIASLSVSEEDEERIKNLQQASSLTDPTRLAAYMGSQLGRASEIAAGNSAGAATGFMGMGMAQGSMGGALSELLRNMGGFQQPQQAPQQAGAASWTCSCGVQVSGNFCPQCGSKKPEPRPAADSWTCQCGNVSAGRFCPQCGAKRPEPVRPEGWTCQCGSVNLGRFCPECGAKKPADAPLYRCDKCGWQPEDPHSPPKFCPECGDPFDEADIEAGVEAPKA